MKGLKVLLEFCVPAVMCPLETFLQLHLFDIVALVFVLLPLKMHMVGVWCKQMGTIKNSKKPLLEIFHRTKSKFCVYFISKFSFGK